ncbi:MAG TPA: M1 family metallopeptidase [Chitinophagaceae bacterium]|nr:M1 family metallopeptidase [Chitinophagaceae bacterium]
MKKYLYLLITTCLLQTTAFAQRPYWQQQVNYTIDVRLNDSANTLDGFAKIDYINNSPDTLYFIWFHIWPNAYKNDQTAFSDQLLENGDKSFYFSDNEKRGYINRLDFRVEGLPANMEDHPEHIDIVKVILPRPLAPGGKLQLTTPFHVKLPSVFSRSGHFYRHYQITQWYPKPAVYDAEGWHPMPYLDQGEFYSEFGDYDVRITVPPRYIVAATGEMTKEEQLQNGWKTFQFQQARVHDFAWFADAGFQVQKDSIRLPSGRVVKAFIYYLGAGGKYWTKAMQYIKDAILFRSELLGEYPYNTVSLVENFSGSGGMEYPTITTISASTSEKENDFVIGHELGHNWFYGILASNERAHPWMDEGLNTYYDVRYLHKKYGNSNVGLLHRFTGGKGLAKKLPGDEMLFALDIVTALKKDQPIATHSEQFTAYNYNVVAYVRTAQWLVSIEHYLGREAFDAAMKAYYEQWKFKHPRPEDFQKALEAASGKSLSVYFDALNKKNDVPAFDEKRKIKFTGLFSMKDYRKVHYIGILPAIGGNRYDKFMIGLGIHNYSLPLNRFRFAVFPLYATNSQQLNGIGKVSYTWLPDKKIYSVQAGITGGRFSSSSGIDSNGNKVFGGFYKIVPFVKIEFNKKRPRNEETWWLDLRSYQIGEKQLDFFLKVSDSLYYPTETKYTTRYLNQLTLGMDNYRTLYPYEAQLQLQQAQHFYRLNFTGNYFFNYANGGGVNLRLFAAKFGYLGNPDGFAKLDLERFQPKLTGVRGNEDYTYSNYFMGRNEQQGFPSQQIMLRDGGLKLRTDLFQGLQGRSENWAAAINLSTTLPDKMFPIKLPIKLFLDVGTHAEAWDRDAATSRFLYVGGLQISIFKFINIYAPVIMSSEFRTQLKTIPEDYKFFKRLSFSIDLHMLNIRKTAAPVGIF